MFSAKNLTGNALILVVLYGLDKVGITIDYPFVRYPWAVAVELWFYLAFAVSSTMMPSESDRHAWLELLISIVVLFAMALLFGAGPWMLSTVAPRLSSFLSSVAVIFGLSAFVHVLLIVPTALIHKLVARVTGVDVA